MNNSPRGAKAWVEKISKQELPALASTVRLLENLTKDNTSSLATLGQAVMHDNALTTRILRVANSAIYMNVNQVTTVSRAAVVLGVQSIKNICITAKLLDSMLASKNLEKSVYDRLLRIMARSYHAGALAKMIIHDHDDDTREQVFIAALLHHLGESAFWSCGGRDAETLVQKLNHAVDEQEAGYIVADTLGTTFDKITIGLVKSWNLGDVLARSLDNPDLRTPELRSIHLANQLSVVLADPNCSPSRKERLMNEVARVMSIKPEELAARVEMCTEKAAHQLKSYGASVLIKYLALTKPIDGEDEEEIIEEQGDPALQLSILREMSFLAMEKTDINLMLNTLLEGIGRGIGIDRGIVLLTAPKQKLLEPRLYSSKNNEDIKQDFSIDIREINNVFTKVLRDQESVWVRGHFESKWQYLMTDQIRNITSPHGFFAAPISIDNRCIGVLYADRASSRRSLSQEEYVAFTHFAQQANLCLTMLSKK